MLIISKAHGNFRAHKTKRPKMNNLHRGRCWDAQSVKLNGLDVDFWFESEWGTSYYFKWENQWYRAPFFNRDFTDNASPELAYHEVLELEPTVK